MKTIVLNFCDPADGNKILTTIVLDSRTKYLPREGEHVTAREQNEKATSHTGVIFCIKHFIDDQQIDVFIHEI
jgi:hypothetical protein